MVWFTPMPEGVRGVVRAVVLVGGVLIAALIAVVGVVRLPPVEGWIGERVAERLPAGVRVERASVGLLPPGLRLDGVALSPTGPVIPSILCQPRFAALLAGRVELAAIRIADPTVTIERGGSDPARTLDAAVAPVLAVIRSGVAAAGQPGTWPALHIDGGVVTLIDRSPPAEPRTLRATRLHLDLGSAAAGTAPLAFGARFEPAGHIDGSGTISLGEVGVPTVDLTAAAQALDAETLLPAIAALVPGGGSVRASGDLDGSLTLRGQLGGPAAGSASLILSSGMFDWDEVHVTAPASGSAQFTATPGTLALSDGRLAIARLAAARVAATQLAVAFVYADRMLDVHSAQAEVFGGSWTQRGTVTLADAPRYDMAVTADGLDCTALLTAVTGRPPQYGCERLSADAAVRGVWAGAKTVARRAEGNGRIEMRGGTIPSTSVIGAVWNALAPLLKVSADRDLGPPTAVDRLTESFTLNGGTMRTADLTLTTADYILTGSGGVGLDGALDLDADIAMTPSGVTRLLTVAAVPIPGTPGRLPPIPARITGTIADPLIRPDARHLPMLAISTVFAGVRGAGGLLGDAAESGLRALERGIGDPW